MNVVRCENNHFFDSDTYTECPVCGRQQLSEAQKNGISGKGKKKGGLFGMFKKDKSEPAPGISSYAASQTPSVPSVPSSKPEVKFSPAPQSVICSPEAYDTEDAVTVPLPAVIPDEDTGDTDAVTVPMPAVIENSMPAKQNTIIAESPASPEPSSLSEAIKQASANSEGKTASYFSAVTSGNSAVSESSAHAPAQQNENTEPVVGWLVCIEGKHTGTSFCIQAGKNTIGRSSSNTVVLSRDNSVSREKHAIVVYEPKKRNFFIQPGDSSGLTYLNDEYITESTKLSERDIIETGSSKLMFVPLCSENFSWEDYLNKEK